MSNTVAGDSKGTFITGAVGVALAVALGAGMWSQHSQVQAVRGELATTQKNMDSMRGQLETTTAAQQREADERMAKLNARLAEELTAAKKNAQIQVSRVQANATKANSKLVEDFEAKNAALTSQLDSIKQSSESKDAQIDEALGGIKTDVGTVRTEVATTRSDLDKTNMDLKRMTGDMGVMSGLIATNSTELEQLRKLGERDYFEFTLNKASKDVQKVGSVQLALKKADTKRSRFTIDVIADDRKVEKRDKTINEPVQFYTAQARIPFELVVNQIGKDTVSGYLSVPKVKQMAALISK
jgi:hypothetical protein